jgi:hypothetical protein
MQRRCYWKLAGNPNIVLMHYRSPGNIKGRAANAATPLHLQDRNGTVAEGSAMPALAPAPAQADEEPVVAGPVDGSIYQASPASAVDGVSYHPDAISVPSPDGAASATDGAVDTSIPAPSAGSMIVPAPPAVGEPPSNSLPTAHGWEYSTSRDWYHPESMVCCSVLGSVTSQLSSCLIGPFVEQQVIIGQEFSFAFQHRTCALLELQS